MSVEDTIEDDHYDDQGYPGYPDFTFRRSDNTGIECPGAFIFPIQPGYQKSNQGQYWEYLKRLVPSLSKYHRNIYMSPKRQHDQQGADQRVKYLKNFKKIIFNPNAT